MVILEPIDLKQTYLGEEKQNLSRVVWVAVFLATQHSINQSLTVACT
jgi:hypothetical protein